VSSDEARRVAIAALLVTAVALLLRLVHLYALRAGFAGTELFSIPRVDAEHHWLEALEILERNFRFPDRVPWKGPGYSYFLAGLAAVLGRSPGRLRWAVALLGALNCGLLVLLARRLLDLRFAVIAGLVASVNGVLILFDTELFQPTLLVILGLALFFLLGRPDASTAAHAGAGAVLGLAVVVHPGYLLSAIPLTIWTAKRNLRHAAVLLVATGAVIAPVTLTNGLAHGQRLLVSWNGGVNLYVANHPTYDQFAGNGSSAWGRVLRAPVDLGMDRAADRDRLYYSLAARQAMRYPVETIKALLVKTLIFFSPVEYASNIRLYELRRYSPVLAATLGRWGPLWIPFGLWGPAALIGLYLALRRGHPLTVTVALWSLGVLLTNVIFFNTARYRAPAVFFGCIWVAVSLSAAWSAWRQGDRRSLVVGACVYCALAVLLAATAVPQVTLPPPLEWYQARALTPDGPYDEAHRWAELAIERDPTSAVLIGLVSNIYRDWDRGEIRRAYLRRQLALEGLEPDVVDYAHENLADSFAREGRFDEARAEYLAALAVGVDAAEWRGYPHYALGLPPVRSCILRLDLANVELLDGERAAATALLDRVRQDCPATGKVGERLGRLEAWMEARPQ
jgi:tetratricopeptide (TPR) repeat protein